MGKLDARMQKRKRIGMVVSNMDKVIGAGLVDEVRGGRNSPYESMGVHVARHDKERMRSTAKTRKSAETRRRIMEKASELMVERGNTAFQMSEISRRCGMSKGALYYYFADKEDLLRAIYDDEIGALVRSIDAAIKEADTAEEALRGACGVYADCVRREGPLAMALVRELVLARESGEGSEGAGALHHIVSAVAEQIERAKNEGVIRSNVDVHLAAVSVCGAFAFTAMSASDPHGNIDGNTFEEDLFDLIVRGTGT